MLATKMILEKEFRNRMEHSFILGISFGLDKGREEGIVKGIELGKLRDAKNMLKENISLDIVEKVTGLKEEEIVIWQDYLGFLLKKDERIMLETLKVMLEENSTYNIMEHAEFQGIDHGKKVGMKYGKIEGMLVAKIEDAKNMLKENIDIDIIERVTGLKREQFM